MWKNLAHPFWRTPHMPYKPIPFDPATVNDASPLVLKQQLYSWCVSRLLTWVYDQMVGVRLVMGEQFVGLTDARDGDHDGPHRADGAHYHKTGGDWDLFINCTFERPQGEYCPDGGHPIWKMIGEKWKSLHPLCRWGGDFASRDSNHLSILHNNVA